MQEIFLCSICNVSSGSCAEDCAYCTQSAKYNAEIDKYKYKPIPQILEEAKRASKMVHWDSVLLQVGALWILSEQNILQKLPVRLSKRDCICI